MQILHYSQQMYLSSGLNKEVLNPSILQTTTMREHLCPKYSYKLMWFVPFWIFELCYIDKQR